VLGQLAPQPSNNTYVALAGDRFADASLKTPDILANHFNSGLRLAASGAP
jgi:hypothetical protein